MTRLRRILVAAAMLASACGVGAQSTPEGRLSPDDVQAVFETLFYRGCQRQVGGLLQTLERDVPSLKADRDTQSRICSCTVKLLMESARMKAVFELPPDKLRVIESDPDVGAYVKAKTVVSLFQCTGHVYDQQLDPRSKP